MRTWMRRRTRTDIVAICASNQSEGHPKWSLNSQTLAGKPAILIYGFSNRSRIPASRLSFCHLQPRLPHSSFKPRPLTLRSWETKKKCFGCLQENHLISQEICPRVLCRWRNLGLFASCGGPGRTKTWECLKSQARPKETPSDCCLCLTVAVAF